MEGNEGEAEGRKGGGRKGGESMIAEDKRRRGQGYDHNPLEISVLQCE